MVNEVAYNCVGRASPDEQTPGRTGFGTTKAGTQQIVMVASIGTFQNRIKIWYRRSCGATINDSL